MAQTVKSTESQRARRRAAAERMHGMFAHVAPGENLVDELISDRRAEARAEELVDQTARHRGDS